MLLSYDTFSQSFQYLQHSRQISTSDNAALLSGGSSLYANPANILSDQRWDFQLSGQNRYGTDIRSISGAALYRTSYGGLGVLVGQYGIDGFSHRQLSISYARAIGPASYLGIQGHRYQLQIEGLGQRNQMDMTVGLLHRISDVFRLSLYVLNPLEATQETQDLYGKVDLGGVLKISDKLEIYSSLSRSWDGVLSLRPGLIYNPAEILSLYLSTNTSPSAMSFGMDLSIARSLAISLGINTHPILGDSLSVSIGYVIE